MFYWSIEMFGYLRDMTVSDNGTDFSVPFNISIIFVLCDMCLSLRLFNCEARRVCNRGVL